MTVGPVRQHVSDPPVPMRVHVTPLGFEYARIREPIMAWRADRVVAVEHADGADVPYLRELLAELEASDRIELERRTCDVFDLYEALGTIAGAAHDHADDEVYVNLSAGSKITAIAGMIACMATGARPIYARPDYGPDAERVPEEPIHEEVAEVFELPTYPIERPSRTHVAFMAYLDAGTTEDEQGRYRGVSKKELVEFAREEAFPFVRESEATTEKGYYRLLESHVVGPLRENGYVQIERVGRNKYVALTESGERTLRAFRYLVE